MSSSSKPEILFTMPPPQPITPPGLSHAQKTDLFYARAEGVMSAGGLGKYNNSIEHQRFLFFAVDKAVEEGRMTITSQDMVEAEGEVHAQDIRRAVYRANQAMKAVEERWKADCAARAAAP